MNQIPYRSSLSCLPTQTMPFPQYRMQEEILDPHWISCSFPGHRFAVNAVPSQWNSPCPWDIVTAEQLGRNSRHCNDRRIPGTDHQRTLLPQRTSHSKCLVRPVRWNNCGSQNRTTLSHNTGRLCTNQSINQGERFSKLFLLLRALTEIRRRSLGVCRKIGHWPWTLSSVKMWGMSVECDKWDESVRTPWAFPCRIKWRLTENGLTRHERLSHHYGHYTLLLLGSTWTNSFLSDRAINDKNSCDNKAHIFPYTAL